MQDEIKVWVISRKLKKRTSYDLRWWDAARGKFRSRCAGTDKRVADREAVLMEQQLNRGTYREMQRVTWGEFVDEHVAAMDRAAETVKDTERTLREFGRVCTPAGPHRVDFRMIETYAGHLRTKGNAVATRNKRLRYIRAALNMAIDRDYLAKNPMDKWKWTREESKIPRALSDEEKLKLLAACPSDQWRAFVYVALTTGCRRGELLGLAWSRVDFDGARLIIIGTKTHQDRVQPLNAKAVTMLRDLQAITLKDGGPFSGLGSPATLCAAFKRIVTKAGIEHCTIHDLRRTFCTDLARLGVNQLVVQRLAGHAASATTAKFYQHIDDGTKRDAVAKLTRVAG